ncbi:MAG: hypothetical protein QGD92_01230 [Gammaproteobacteria bacterium]|nr:hypothetical protein [Gammaproteobacteria bacterium]
MFRWNCKTNSAARVRQITNRFDGLFRLCLWRTIVHNAVAEDAAVLEYDSDAVEGIEEMDQTYKFRIGSIW